MDDFKNAPVSIAEVRSDKTKSALDWTPRDALIWMLREIDNGTRNVDHVVICWREALAPDQYDAKNESPYHTEFRQAGGDPWAWSALGLLERVKHLINSR